MGAIVNLGRKIEPVLTDLGRDVVWWAWWFGVAKIWGTDVRAYRLRRAELTLN